MQTRLSHLQVNVAAANIPFYRDLMAFLGWPTIMDDDSMPALGVAGQSGDSLWFMGIAEDANNNYDGPGVNHIGIGADVQADVDTVVQYLKEKGVPALFDTPRHRPDFAMGEDQTYYQVMFESPDKVLFEVVYTGPK